MLFYSLVQVMARDVSLLWWEVLRGWWLKCCCLLLLKLSLRIAQMQSKCFQDPDKETTKGINFFIWMEISQYSNKMKHEENLLHMLATGIWHGLQRHSWACCVEVWGRCFSFRHARLLCSADPQRLDSRGVVMTKLVLQPLESATVTCQ